MREKVLIEFFAWLVLLAGICTANEATTCPSSVGTELEGVGQSLLQARRGEIVARPHKQQHRNGPEDSNTLSLAIAAASSNGSEPLLGSLAALTEEGYRSVVGTCCHLQMELFIHRLITSLGLDLCDELRLLDLLPLYATCDIGVRDIATLTSHIQATAKDPDCKMVAPSGSCPAKQLGCMADPLPTAHRRRRCKKHKQKAKEGDQCPLPADAAWCEVRLKNHDPYFIAVYDTDVSDDWVSHNICQAGFFEERDLTEFGTPGHMLDIGGNLGFHTFAFAQAGWNVTTFEPMAPNLALINATQCRNPSLAARIQLNPFGLGATSEQCKMMAPTHNVGDGHVKCGDVAAFQEEALADFKEIGQFDIRRLDEVLLQQNITKVDLVKIDVEGYEAQVFAGAPHFLTQYRPRVVRSEVWKSMVNSSGIEYLRMFENAGYKFFSDRKCEVPLDAKSEVLQRGFDVSMCIT